MFAAKPMKYLLLALIALSTPLLAAADRSNEWDILVVAPHPDDETLGAAGVIMQGLEQGKRVGVVVLTNGDGYPLAASTVTGTTEDKLTAKDFIALASARQQYVEKSLELIDFPLHNLHFLGYPDGGLSQMYKNGINSAYLNTLTQQAQTYRAHRSDYHSANFGKTAPYTSPSIKSDLIDIIKRKNPSSIYVTTEHDDHGDHQAAFWFTRDAAISAGYSGTLNTYLIHSGSEHGDWPYPYQEDHSGRFEAHRRGGEQIPSGLEWPPSLRIPLTPSQARKKFDMINQFDAEIITAANYMRAFVKSEEIFWPVTIQQN